MPIALTIDDIKNINPVLLMKNKRWYELDMLPEGQETNELKQYCKIKDSPSLNAK